MRGPTKRVLTIWVVCLVASTPLAARSDRTYESDLTAIRDLMSSVVTIISSPAFRRATTEERLKSLEPFYRPDVSPGALGIPVERALADDEMPMFFGPPPSPIVSGSGEHLANTVMNLDQLFVRGGTYQLTIDKMQILLDTRLAVVLAVTTSTIKAPHGGGASLRGRATTVLEKMTDGRWVIAHESLALVGSSVGTSEGDDRIRRSTPGKP